jgi:hypothetical protein
MSNRNLSKAFQTFTREVTRLCRSMTKGTIDWLLRSAFVMSRKVSPNSGIVLPTAIMLILVVSLAVGALTYRAYTRNIQVITSNQQRVIYNAATPAIDRARSKLEFMFDSSQDNRYPSGGVPAEDYLAKMMLNDGVGFPQSLIKGETGDAANPYLLPGETARDLPNTPGKDNAWSFRADTDGNGTEDATVVYSIIFRTPTDADPATSQRLLVTETDKQKSDQGVVRHGPLTTETGSACQLPSTSATPTSVGWFSDPTNTSIVRKNFQVDVLVVPDTAKSAATTIEFHQDREISKGNKWGAWFRNDLEVFPGPAFRFNGAMHTEGNLIVGSSSGQTQQFQSFLISSKNSCLYPPIDNSEISITTGSVQDNFKGAIVAGTMGFLTDTGGGFKPHYQQAGQPTWDTIIDKNNATAKPTVKPKDVYSDPVAILTQDTRQTQKLGTGGSPPYSQNNSNNVIPSPTYNSSLQQRITFHKEATPYIDDLSRADGRWGPKSTYPSSTTSSGGGAVTTSAPVPDRNDSAKTGYGYAIPNAQSYLTTKNVNPPKSDAKDLTDEGVGADGYWEARARNEGLRILVGERLELGNPFGWVTPRDGDGNGYISSDPTGLNEREGDPLYPPGVKPYPVQLGTTISHVQQQHRTLRDNLAAVQATALYHTDFINQGLGADYPFACLATTAHPGTPTTLRQSTNFVPTRFNDGSVDLLSDFFSGRGTNGWEFEPPAAGNPDAFKIAIGATKPLGIALRNLAHFAGDPDGAFPPKQNDVMHPYPALSMWGNFSNLRRALDLIDSGTSYDSLSTADKTYIQTASCTVGMLAYEIDTVQKFDPTNLKNNTGDGLGLSFNPAQSGKLMLQLGADLYDLMNEDSIETNRVLPKALINQFQYKSTGTRGAINPRDYYSVPPEAYIEALRQQYTEKTANGYGIQAVNNSKLRMAELIMLNFQIRRDRTFGFRPSPSFGHYAIQLVSRGVLPELAVYPSACDPDLFKIDDGALRGDDVAKGLLVSVNDDGTPKAIADFAPSPILDAVKAQKLVRARLGLSRLCGALNIPAISSPPKPTDYDVSKAYSISDPNQDRPVVMPKFPALYYIFPQKEHGLNGDSDGGVDTRQPGYLAATDDGTPAQKKLGLKSTDKESYIVDLYVQSSLGSYKFQPVQQGVAANGPSPSFTGPSVDAAVPTSSPNAVAVPTFARFPDENRPVFPTPDYKVDNVAIKPRNLPGLTLNGSSDTWRLPSSSDVIGTAPTPNNANVPTNIIEAPMLSGKTLVNTPVAVPFLDRAFFDGRQLMLARTLDLDVGMMRSAKTRLQGGQRGEPLLPMSGIVYAFREDSVREDAIARPVGTRMNATDPTKPTDPALTQSTPTTTGGISTKSVDYLPDPSRRIHGFRLRNGRQVKRDTGYESGIYKAADNYRGLSFFSDQPLYIQGDLNRHQAGSDDTIGEPLEEFTGGTDALIRGQDFNETKFYNRGGGGSTGKKDDRFASLTGDRWRPTELLADSISILSDNFCDGSISDMFVSYDTGADKGYQLHPKTQLLVNPSQLSIYHDGPSFTKTGLYGLGCASGKGYTSFKNSDRPDTQLSSTVTAKTGLYDWLRENPNVTSYNALVASSYEPGANTMPAGDYATPIKISRSGLPLLSQPSGLPTTTVYDVSKIDQKLSAVGTTYAYADKTSPDTNVKAMKFGAIQKTGGTRKLVTASSLRSNDATNINSIVVSGIVPSQPGNSYGGLHNFPRFVENWTNTTLDYVGSFLQLNFSNYATAPFQMMAWEYDDSGAVTPPFDGNENLEYYGAPNRQWGYDVALQLAPAGPAASRFVIVKTPRNEFYSEPQINDPYIQNLCQVAKTNNFKGAANLNCTN